VLPGTSLTVLKCWVTQFQIQNTITATLERMRGRAELPKS
jgi:hypothetical protein